LLTGTVILRAASTHRREQEAEPRKNIQTGKQKRRKTMERAARTFEVTMNVLRDVRNNWQEAETRSVLKSSYRKLS